MGMTVARGVLIVDADRLGMIPVTGESLVPIAKVARIGGDFARADYQARCRSAR